MKRVGIFLLTLSSVAAASQTITIQARGRTYTVTSTKLASAVFSFPNHWLYEPSVVLASPITNNQYYLILASNLNANDYAHDQAIFVSSSGTPTSFGQPTTVLRMSATSNICDMIDTRPYWDGARWHVYVQARGGFWSGSAPVCTGTIGVIFEATGASLTSLQWVYDIGFHAKPIGYPRLTTGDGIGEEFQWYNTLNYLGPPGLPIMDTYNDWGYCG